MSKVQIIFDFDGVILSSHKIKTIAFFHIFKDFGTKKARLAQKYHTRKAGISRYKKFDYIKKNILLDQTVESHLLNKKFKKFCYDKIVKLILHKKRFISSKTSSFRSELTIT